MKIPLSPPGLADLAQQADEESLLTLLGSARPVDGKGRYLHWDQMRHRTPPEGLTREQWWLGTALSRRVSSRPLPLTSIDGSPFRFTNVDQIQEMVHRIDQQASGHILTDQQVMNPQSSDRYLVSSLVEEAITSSLLEGAATTRRIAKELLRSGRRPVDKAERMVVNNFMAMEATRHLAERGEPLTPDAVLELHRIVTSGTLEDEADAGHYQRGDDQRVAIVWDDGTILHRPPPASELPERLDDLCRFANEELGEGFLHPVIRAIVLHFWVGYDHPFADGNGRLARALFYWSMPAARVLARPVPLDLQHPAEGAGAVRAVVPVRRDRRQRRDLLPHPPAAGDRARHRGPPRLPQAEGHGGEGSREAAAGETYPSTTGRPWPSAMPCGIRSRASRSRRRPSSTA